MTYKSTNLDALTGWTQLPLQERVLDKLADILFASDEILDMLHGDPRQLPDDESLAAIETSVRHVYHEVNELMKQFSD